MNTHINKNKPIHQRGKRPADKIEKWIEVKNKYGLVDYKRMLTNPK